MYKLKKYLECVSVLSLLIVIQIYKIIINFDVLKLLK